MAYAVSRYTLGDSTDGSTFATASFTPGGGELLVAFLGLDGYSGGRLDLNSTGIGFGRAQSALSPVNSNFMGCYIAAGLQPNSPSAMTLSVDLGAATATGASWIVLGIQGMQKVGGGIGLGAEANSATTGGPASATPTFSTSAGDVNNLIVSAVMTGTNPPALTPPTNFTTLASVGHAVPAYGMQIVTRPFGGCPANLAWGSASGGAYDAIYLEVSSDNLDPVDRPQFMSGSGI